MIYGLLPYYARKDVGFLRSLSSQTSEYRLIVCDAGLSNPVQFLGATVLSPTHRTYWTESMNLIYQYVCDTEEILDSDVVIILNDDLTFHSRFFEEMEQVQLGQVFLPTVIEDGVLIDGGLHVDWKHKKFTVSDPIDCFSPRGISMRVKDFRSSCGFDADLPHKLSDLEWSMRLINSGIKPIRRGIVETYRGKEPFRLSVLSGKNPWYNSKLYFRHPYRWRNIVKEWIGLFLP